jgi:hypothetical protein
MKLIRIIGVYITHRHANYNLLLVDIQNKKFTFSKYALTIETVTTLLWALTHLRDYLANFKASIP